MATLTDKIVDGKHYACVVDGDTFLVYSTGENQTDNARNIVFAGCAEKDEALMRESFPEHESLTFAYNENYRGELLSKCAR